MNCGDDDDDGDRSVTVLNGSVMVLRDHRIEVI